MSAAERTAPSWQTEPCPSWCIRHHEEYDGSLGGPDDGDRDHCGFSAVVPVRRLVRCSPEESRGWEDANLCLMPRKRHGDREVTIDMHLEERGTPPHGAGEMEFTAASWRRIAQGIDDLLDDLMAG